MRMLAGLTLAAAVLASDTGTITVELEKKLVPDPIFEVTQLTHVPDLPEGLQAFSGELPLRKGAWVRVLVMERAGSKPVWLIDRNLDGQLSMEEQVEVGNRGSVVEFPLDGERFPSYPLALKAVDLPPDFQADTIRRKVRLLYYSHAAAVTGKADLEGVRYDCYFRVNPETFEVSLSQTMILVDLDRDGEIDRQLYSEEMIRPRGKPAVFKIGLRYYRFDGVDTKSLKAQIRQVDESQYRLISMRAGRVLPNFSFLDFDGVKHELYAERGARYTLLYFWASWCAMCATEIGVFEEAHAKYREKGLRIVGINGDRDTEAARRFMKQHRASFTQATWESVKELVEDRYQIIDWPTAILLDADLRVVSTNTKDEMRIRKEGLMPTLEKLFGLNQTE
jgi:thiol-disulfide isomerase/thioredoxin